MSDWDGDGTNNPLDGCDNLLGITTINYGGTDTWNTHLSDLQACDDSLEGTGNCPSPQVQLLDRGEQQGGCPGNQVATAIIVRNEEGASTEERIFVQCAEVVVSC